MTKLTSFRDRAGTFLAGGMSKHDRQRWASCRNADDLAACVIDWLNGRIDWTPGHGGGPDPETFPLRPALEVLNRGWFITDCSQLAESIDGRSWNTWVDGWADDEVLERIRAAAEGTDLIVSACRGTSHDCGRICAWWCCPWQDSAGFWSDRCPGMDEVFYGLWYVHVEDPVPGRNDLMWPALTGALAVQHEAPGWQDVEVQPSSVMTGIVIPAVLTLANLVILALVVHSPSFVHSPAVIRALAVLVIITPLAFLFPDWLIPDRLRPDGL